MPISVDEMLEGANLIVRVSANEYAVPAQGERFRLGFQLGAIRFVVLETVKGDASVSSVVLPGVLTERDDFNDHDPPYRFVRPEGRHGNCFADAYRRGAQFLLFLVGEGGHYGLYPEALGPVNEQLRSTDDPWLVWVKAARGRQVAGTPNKRVQPAATHEVAPVAASGRRGLRADR